MKLLLRFRNSSIRTKYLTAVAALVALLSLCGVYIYQQTARTLYQSCVDGAKADFINTYNEMERFEERLNHLATLLQNDTNLINLLSGTQDYSMNEYQHARQDLLPRLYSMLDGSDDYFCRLYVGSTLDIADRSSRLLMLSDVAEEPWAQQALSGWGWRSFFTQEELQAEEPALIAPLRRLDDRRVLVAMLRVDIRPAALSRMMELSQGGAFISFRLETVEGAEIVAQGLAEEGSVLGSLTDKEKEGFLSYELGQLTAGRDTVFLQRLSRSGWRLVLRVHHDALNRSIWSQASTIYVGAVLFVLAGMLCSLPILWHTTSRIRRFYEHVGTYNRHTSGAHITPERLQPQAEDEIGLLIREHNAMLDRIDELISEQEASREERRQLEINALQAQIKPHFLYNTLEAITWMARLNEVDKVEDTIYNLTRFYRLCLSRGVDVLPLEKELEIVRHYFAIASSRYGSKYALHIDVDPRALPLELPKITLQPLVENALIHGLLESGKDEGTVYVYTELMAEGWWKLCVADTGAHFDEEIWERIITGKMDVSSGNGESYGLRNVERRLCLYFGLEHALTMENADGRRTVIYFPLS